MMRKYVSDGEELEVEEAYIQTPGPSSEAASEVASERASSASSFDTFTDEERPHSHSEDGDISADSDDEMTSFQYVGRSLFTDSDLVHSLLEEKNPTYSNLTVRRAFIVWAHGGQVNDFKQVCEYYRRLEAVEETFTPEQRMQSRLPEFRMLSAKPQTSDYQMSLFPNLYAPSSSAHSRNNSYHYDNLTSEDRVFTLEGFLDLKVHNGVTNEEVFDVSTLIKKYCLEHRNMTLKKLLCKYQDFNRKCGFKNTLNSLTIYVKKLFVIDEMVLRKNMRNISKGFGFLDDDDDEDASKPFRKAIERPVKLAAAKGVIPDAKKPNVCESLLSSLQQSIAAFAPSTSYAPATVNSPSTSRPLCTTQPQSPAAYNASSPWPQYTPIHTYYPQAVTSYSPQTASPYPQQTWSPFNPQQLSVYNAQPMPLSQPQPLSAYSPEFRAFMAKFMQGTGGKIPELDDNN